MAVIVINPMRKQGLKLLLKGQFMGRAMVMAVGMTRVMGMRVIMVMAVIVVMGMRVVVAVVVCHNITPFKYFFSFIGSGVY